ncbi:VOC family protein [Citricoccus nitrophenolicus]|uniref:Glyoxalase-like protein n=1 Tax=Citricoccus muralis TaxID=169134 RepID=A0A3D9L813_9MICC|nr:VOC family protein [Citricoccus muralis]REE02498.1 glyoxalase-like protein [Citricoccus muralis]
MGMMRLDHVSYAVGPEEGLAATVARLAETLGIERVKGGVHPRFGTRNAIFPLRNRQYLEVVEVLDHPSSEKAPFGQAVRARSEMGGGWMGWCVTVDDLAPFEERLERQSVPGNRKFPDGRELTWRQIGIKGLIADPQVPYLLRWDEGTEELHPSQAHTPQAELSSITIAGSRDRVRGWLGLDDPEETVGDLNVVFESPSGTPGILEVTFETPKGTITL